MTLTGMSTLATQNPRGVYVDGLGTRMKMGIHNVREIIQ